MATIVEFRDGKKDYAGTVKYDGTLEGRPKFEEDFEKVARAKNMTCWLIAQEIIAIRPIAGDFLGGYESDYATQPHPPKVAEDLRRWNTEEEQSSRWAERS